MNVTFVFKPGVERGTTSRGPIQSLFIIQTSLHERKEKPLLCNRHNEKETSKELKAFLQNHYGVPVAYVTYIESKAINALAELLIYRISSERME